MNIHTNGLRLAVHGEEVKNLVFGVTLFCPNDAELMATRYNDLLDLVDILLAEQKPSIRAMRQLVKIRRP